MPQSLDRPEGGSSRDQPLPPRRAEMPLMTREMVQAYEPSSYQPMEFFAAADWRETGFSELSRGEVGIGFMRTNQQVSWRGSPWHMHHADGISFITRGWALFEMEGLGLVKFEPGMIVYQPAFHRHRELEMSLDCEQLLIYRPAVFDSTLFIYDEETETYREDVVDVEGLVKSLTTAASPA